MPCENQVGGRDLHTKRVAWSLLRAAPQKEVPMCFTPRTLRMQPGSSDVLTVFDVAQAWEQGAFEVHYQEQRSMRTTHLVGAEALLRMRRSDGRLAQPGEFLPLVEMLGLKERVDLWVLRRALHDFSAIPGSPLLSVNVEPATLSHASFAPQLTDVIRASSFPSSLLTLEVTENGVLSASARERVASLRGYGVAISLDDFGTGSARFDFLARTEADELKIDRSLMACSERERGHVVVSSIVELATRLGLRTVAEGIETEAQARAAERMGCTVGQGYLYAKPVAFEVFRERWEACLVERSWPDIDAAAQSSASGVGV